MVNSIPHAVAVLSFKNMHLPIEDDDEFAENATSKPNSENAMMQQMLTMMQQTQNLLVQQQQQQMARPPRSPRQQVAVAAAYDQPEQPGQQNASSHAASRTEDYDYDGREEEALPNEMATYDPTELDYWNGNQEAEACVQQAASVTTARDEESAPEHDYDDAKLEVEACVQQATSVTTACDKESAPGYDYKDVEHEVDARAQQATSVTTARDERSAPVPDCDYNDYNYENPEVEACAQQATSTMAARDEESALVPEHDHDEEKQEAGVCSPQAASVIEARDTKSVLKPDEEDETKTETVAGVCTPLGAAVTTNPDENPATRAESDGSVSAVRVLFKRPVCEPDPDRPVVYESFGCNTGWGPARAALAAQERAALAEASDVSLCEVTTSSNSRRTDEPKGETTTVNTAPTTPDPLVSKHPPTESILSKEDGLNPSPLPKHPPTESILSKEDGSNIGPEPERPLTGIILSEEDGGEPGPTPERDKPEENRAEPSPYARVFTDDELDALEKGEPSSTTDEKEEYEKELEERLFPLDEVELTKRVKQNAEQQRELSLPELSALLDIPEERLARTRDSSPGMLSSPEYWLGWYKETLAASDAAKRANRDFRSTNKDATDPLRVTAVLTCESRERFSRGDERSTPIDSVRSLTPAETGRLLPSRWRALVRRAVYQPVKAEDRLGADSCPSCSSPLSPRRNEREELTDDPPKNCDLPVRARSVIKHSVTTQDEELTKKLVKEVVNAYTTNSTLIQSKVVERGSRCPRCRSLSNLPTRSAAAKRVSFDCSSLFSTRSEAFGFNGNRHDREDGVFEHVYVVTETERPGGRRPGLVEVPVLPEPGEVEGNPFPDGKRIIRSVGGVEAVSVGFIDCVPADMLIDTGAVASHPTASLKPSRMRLGSACVLPSGSFSATSGSGSSSASSDGDDRDVGGGCVSCVSEFQRAGTAACYLNASGQLRTAAMGLEFDSDEHGSDQVGEHASLSDWGVDSDGDAIYVKRVQNGSTQRMWMTLAIVLDIILCGIYNIATAFSLAESVPRSSSIGSTRPSSAFDEDVKPQVGENVPYPGIWVTFQAGLHWARPVNRRHPDHPG
ncbi:hypothetical protein PR003_g21300 [Phytophthora rubi]|uniref:Peptidase A2 domain-containing protein n=1 Tax=Phytophthora rubi TaxID=129364 RepID=A0A6A4DCZ3_9STRA|nr:hypothetical protein PR003_g21300 [Phytophthora rubi]